MYSKCVLLNNIILKIAFMYESENYYFHDISLQNAVTQNHVQRVNTHLVSHSHNYNSWL